MPLPPSPEPTPESPQAGLRGWLRALGVVAVCTAASEVIALRFDLANIIMVYLAGVAWVAMRESARIAVATVVASIILFNLLFVPPRWSLNPLNPSHFFTFAVMLAVGLLVSRLAEQVRRQTRESAQALVHAETERLRSTLLAGISHDLRTPLTTIVGAATSLLEQGNRLDEARRAALTQGLLDEARRLHGLMSDLLDLARMEDGAVQLQPEWCPADDLVAEALALLEPRLHTHDVVQAVPAEAIVWCDPRLVQQALFNLVDNALRHTPAGSRVRIAVGVVPGGCELVVADNGPGLPPGQEEAVLRKFTRGQAEPARSGFGLGLAICHAVARLHGGTLQARNDGGARFTLWLPQPATAVPPPQVP